MVGEQTHEDDALKGEIDKLVEPDVTAGTYAGVVVGTLTPSETRVYGYGTTKLGSAARPIGKTVFEIGSISKVFTALVAAKMIQDGTLKIDQPVASFLPSDVRVPKWEDRLIAVGDLLTHSSGLPRLPDNINLSGLDPYAAYGEKELYAFLGKYTLPRTPGEKVEYSNLGMGLLGHALAHRARRSWASLVKQTICDPLGLQDTVVELSPEQRARLATGYFYDDKDGLQPVPLWTFDALAGAGALRSTADDLLTFLAANIGLRNTSLTSAMQTMHRERMKTDAEELSIALGWHVYDANGQHIVWHNGGTYGAYGFIGFLAEERVGVVVLANTFSTTTQLDAIGLKTLGLLRKKSSSSTWRGSGPS